MAPNLQIRLPDRTARALIRVDRDGLYGESAGLYLLREVTDHDVDLSGEDRIRCLAWKILVLGKDGLARVEADGEGKPQDYAIWLNGPIPTVPDPRRPLQEQIEGRNVLNIYPIR